MAFTFQINSDVKFLHDEALLKKAEALKPKFFHTEVRPVGMVELSRSSTSLGGWTCVPETGDFRDTSMGRNDSVILDFGEHQVGHLTLDLRSVGSPMDAPLTLRLNFAEVPAELSMDASAYDGWLSRSWIQEEVIHVDTLPCALRLPRRYSFRYLKITVIDTSPKWKMKIRDVFCDAVSSAPETFDIPKNVAAVLDQDEMLKKIYQVSVRTLHECMQDVFEDGPKRDRRLWIGDLRLQALADYATYDQSNLVKRCLYLFAGCAAEDGRIPANVFTKPEVIPDDTFLFDYSLFFISILEDYLEHHDDPELLADLFPTAKRQMDAALLYVDENGRLEVPEDDPVFVDWSGDFDKSTAGQAIFIYVMKQYVSLQKRYQKQTGHGPEADDSGYETVLNAMTSYAIHNLYDSNQSLFVSGEKREINLASQVWMALAHVLPDAENEKMMCEAVKKMFPIHAIATPYMYHHVVQALFEAGLKDEAVRLMKAYWGTMVDLGADTFWEAFDPNHPDASPYGSPIVSSYCHAWACTPVWLIRKYLA